MTKRGAEAGRDRRARRGLAIFVLLLFIGGLAGEAYAFHDCPHHHPRSVVPATGHAHASVADDRGHTGHVEGPCCCPGVHDAGSAPALPQDAELPWPALSPRDWPPIHRAAERGFRAAPIVLLPPSTAPPRSPHL